jgi:hypothetical protein
MIIKTRKLPATQHDGERMRATVEGWSATLTIAFPYSSNDPDETVALALMRAVLNSPYSVERLSTHTWRAKEY